MEIRIAPHTLESAEERGTDAEEIADVIPSGTPIPARDLIMPENPDAAVIERSARVYPLTEHEEC